ncbi:hypothetical protein Tco_0533321 [Tanacetum coccineum]
MEESFDQMSAEVDQNTVDKQCVEIERKNLLIANENLIANFLSNQLLFAVEQPHVNSSTVASRSKPRSNTKNNRYRTANSVNQKTVKDYPMTNKSVWTKVNRVDSSISSKRVVVQVVLWYLDSGCSKHMTRNHSKLKNFVEKFIGTVRFGNDHFGAIMGYGDYVYGDRVIFGVYYVEELGHNLFSIGQFCDSDLEIAFRTF